MNNLLAFLANRSPVEDPHTPPPVRPNAAPEFDPAAMAALRVTLKDAQGDWTLITLIAPVGLRRDALLDTLRSWSGKGDVPPLVFSDLALGPNDTLFGHFMDVAVPGAGLVLHGFERYFDQSVSHRQKKHLLDSRLFALNTGRDNIQNIIKGPFVLILDEESSVSFRWLMPDFYSWRVMELTL